MLRIAHLESSINMGGQEIRTLAQIEWLMKNGHSAWLLARPDSAVYAEATLRGLPRWPVHYRGSMHPRAVFELLKFISREKVDLLDCHSSTAACTALIAVMLGIPIVRSSHVAVKNDFIHKLLWNWGSDHIVTVSHCVANDYLSFGLGNRDIISVIPTGIDLDRFNPSVDGASIRREFNLSERTKIISNVAMIRPDKGLKYFIRAVDRIADAVPDSRFMIVGSATKPEFFEELKNEIASIRHRDKVILTGFRRDVEKIFAASDVIVLSSVYEARSQVIPQAFAMKKIVVASNVGGIPESVLHGETGYLFQPENVVSLWRTVLLALQNDNTRITERAYRLAHSELGVETMMQKTMQVYQRLLNIRPRIAPLSAAGHPSISKACPRWHE